MSSHTDKATDSVPPGEVDVDHILNDIHSDRQKFSQTQRTDSAASSREMEKKHLLPECTIVL